MKTTKVCGTCKVDKDTSEFYRNKARPDGLQNSCRACGEVVAAKGYGKGERTPCVYFIEAVGLNSLKVGVTDIFRHRFASLKSSSPVQLNPRFVLKCPSYEKAKRIEAFFKKSFAPYRLHGEWFTICPEIRKFIEDTIDANEGAHSLVLTGETLDTILAL